MTAKPFVAITGATGFVGQAVQDEAVARGLAVRALARREQAPRAGVEWVRGNLADAGALATLVAGAEAVLHIAGVVNAADRAGFVAGNVAGTAAVVAAAQAAGVRRFVHVSSLSAREPGLSDYAFSKARAEAEVCASALDWTLVRPPLIYGPRDTEVFETFRGARAGVLPQPSHGRTSVIHVADLARLLLDLVADRGSIGACFDPDDGRPGGWPLAELAQAIGAAVGRGRVWAPVLPGWLLKGAARLDRLARGPNAKLTPDRARYMVHPDWASDPAHAVPAALWQPRIATLQGLADTARWYREAGWM